MPNQIIANYRDLQDRVAAWLNRTDPGLVNEIPTFIYLAERKIFRRYRAPNNERTLLIDQKFTPDPMVSTDVPLSDEIPLPEDYLEVLTIQANGRPLKRVSITDIQNRQQTTSPINSTVTAGAMLQRAPALFARERGSFFMWPPPIDDTLIDLIYYSDLSGTLVEDTDTNDVLRIAPDLYLYGALLQAQPFLKPEAEELQLIEVWNQFYDDAFDEIEVMRDNAEFSGSVTEVRNAFSGSARVRSGSIEGILNGNRL